MIRLVVQAGILAFLSLTVSAQQFGGNRNDLDWKIMSDAHSRIVFPAGSDSQANRIRQIISVLHTRNEKTDSIRFKRWPVILQSHSIVPNAYVRLAPVMSELYMTAPQDNFSLGSLRWDDNLIIHEQRHMRQFSFFDRGLTRVFSFFLGEEGRLLANGMTIPDYFFEGDAVWQETALSPQGRGRLLHFMNPIRSIFQEGKSYSWMTWRAGSLRRQLPDHYALGYLMVTHGMNRYGKDFWDKVTKDASSFKGLMYPFQQAIQKHSGLSYKTFTQQALKDFAGKLNGDSMHVASPAPISAFQKSIVTEDHYPVALGRDSLLVLQKSYNRVPAFCVITPAGRKLIRVRDIGIDNQFSSDGRQIVYAAYTRDARRGNQEFSVIRLLDIRSGKQRNLGSRTRYFSPVIRPDGQEILVVEQTPDSRNQLVRLRSLDAVVLSVIPNPGNLFYTQSVYTDSQHIVSAVRSPQGKMALLYVDLNSGQTRELVPFSYVVIGYPSFDGRKVYFSAQGSHSDQAFSVSLQTGDIQQETNYSQPVYYPVADQEGNLYVSVYSTSGLRLAKVPRQDAVNRLIRKEAWGNATQDWSNWQPLAPESNWLDTLSVVHQESRPFKKTGGLFHFHSRRPVADDPEWGYSLFTDNFFSTMSGSLTYTYNRVERSHSMGAALTFGQWVPFTSLSAEAILNRTLDTALGKTVQFNSAKWSGGLALPLEWVSGRNSNRLVGSLTYNHEQLYYRGIGKNIFQNDGFNYFAAGLSVSRSGQQARQHIFPRWAQSVSASFRQSLSLSKRNKFTLNSSWYFPALAINHNLVVQASFQKRDSLPDIFSNSFSYTRGYDALSTRQMYKWGVNYHLPLAYPDWGVGNILYCLRIRANFFYDHTVAKARLNGLLTDIRNRSAGLELFFDNKLWNALPVSFGFRYAHLLDVNLRNPSLKNRWEIILPIGIIPD